MYGKHFNAKSLRALACFILALAIVLATNVAAVTENEDVASDIAVTNNTSQAFEAGYTEVASSDGYVLLADMNKGNFILKDRSGHYWYSSPQDISEDPYSKAAAKNTLRSLISVNYINTEEIVSTAKEYTINSHAAVSTGGVEVTRIENGVRVAFKFEEQGLYIPIEYTLVNDYLNVSIDVDGISEGEDYKIISIALLPGFCTGSWKQDGYIFVPDGCGALINYNNGSEDKYEEMVYGDELAIEKELNSVVKQTVRLPVFGTASQEQGMLGVITEGDGSALISAMSSNSSNGYNSVNSSFVMRSITPKAMLTKSYAKQYAYRISETDKNLKNYTVRYYPHINENANYTGFAKTYREYLINEKGLKKNTAAPSFNVSLIGAVDVKANFLGFTYYKPYALTDFDKAVEIIKALNNVGIDNVSVRYEGWQNNGLVNRKIPTSAKAMTILGGKKGFNELISFAQESDIPLYTDADLVNYNGGSNKNAAKTVYNEVAKQYSYMYSVYAPRLDTKASKLLSPSNFVKTAEKYLKSYKKLGNTNLSIASLSNTIYSDLGSKNSVIRSSVPQKIESILETYSASGLSLAGDSANAYAAPYMSKIYNTPSTCSGFLMENEEIPFYQIVFHGYASLTMPSQERVDSPTDNYLTAVETGSELLWTGIAEDASMLSDTTSDRYYSTTYTLWLEDAAQKYKEYMPLLSKVANSEIVSHTAVSDDVTETVFEGGITVTVNHGEEPYVTDEAEIPAKSFAVS